MYFIYWKSLTTKICSHGESIHWNPQEYIQALNEKWSGEIVHKYAVIGQYNEIVNNLANYL